MKVQRPVVKFLINMTLFLLSPELQNVEESLPPKASLIFCDAIWHRPSVASAQKSWSKIAPPLERRILNDSALNVPA